MKPSRTIPAGMQAASQKTPSQVVGISWRGFTARSIGMAAAEWPDSRPDASVLLPEGIIVMSL